MTGGRITHALAGKTIEHVLRNDELLVIRATDGTEVRISWRDETSRRLPGQPFVEFCGTNIIAEPVIIPRSAIGRR